MTQYQTQLHSNQEVQPLSHLLIQLFQEELQQRMKRFKRRVKLMLRNQDLSLSLKVRVQDLNLSLDPNLVLNQSQRLRKMMMLLFPHN